jgi:glycine hydroxymethyltransferase
MIPFDEEKPKVTSGIRLGTPAMTTRGWKEAEFTQLGHVLIKILKENNEVNTLRCKQEIAELLVKFPIYKNYELS